LSARGGPLLKRIERLIAPAPETASGKLALPALLVACASMLIQTHGPSSKSPAHPMEQAASGARPAADISSASPLQLPVSARHMLVLDDLDGKVLMAKDADAVVPIASLTKLMTAMVVLDAKLDPNEKLRIVRADSPAQNRSPLADGAQVPRAVALQLALMSSENRAAAALARTYPGGEGAFALALRAKILSLGLTRTTIIDPTGRSPANTSTATEVAKIVAAAARYPDIARITSHQQASVAVDGRRHEFHNTNPLVGGKGWDIRLSKTGNSAQAGSCLSMRMRSGDRDVTVVLLDADGAQRRSLDAGKIRDSLAASSMRIR